MATISVDTDTLSSDIVVIEINGSPQLFSSDYDTRQRQLQPYFDNGDDIGNKLWPPGPVGPDFPKDDREDSPLLSQVRQVGGAGLQTVEQPRATFDPTTREPAAVREAGIGRPVAPVPVPFPEMGGLRFRSEQSRRNMLPIERAAFQNAVQRQGIPLQDYMEQEQRATSIGGPRNIRARFAPTRRR